MLKTKLLTLIVTLVLGCIISCSNSEIDPVIDGSEDPIAENIPAYEGPVYAFPGAEGFGQFATGGRGGKVYYVTKLTDDGSVGTLRHAVSQSGKRTIVFNVAGTIQLRSRLLINFGDLTIAGQSAPGGGITIRDFPVVINASNVIIRYLRFRMGDEAKQQGDALEARFQKDIIIDHCSMSWSTDETATFYANENTTLQWCIISESLKNSVHEKGSHGYGGIWGGKNASFHHNLLAHHDSRNPRLGEEAGKAFALTDKVDVRNNVIYNWGSNSTYGGEAMNVNLVNNYYKPGPATPTGSKRNRIVSIDKNKNSGTEVFDIWGKFFIDGNVVEGSIQTSSDNWKYGVLNQFHSSYGVVPEAEIAALRLTQPHDILDNVHTHTAEEALALVLEHAGSSRLRDEVDLRIIKNLEENSYSFEGSLGSTHGIIDSQADVGGWPVLAEGEPVTDSDLDGIPDSWENENSLDPQDSTDAAKIKSGTPYSYLEIYLNSLIKNFPIKN
ncbi:pectate lyase [Algoriphagus halophytocola]|uniref:Pectate lyase n=1 Tax=Algoriphagus halophytocola TaxID=2991499 RepID=A0ABY6MPZ6_9BACT|nr:MULTISPECIES: pectate lyase [unclassified Algoriphagus]UZD24519.1 pectate lyase [Algoriphagus sp. TR-M5]WBL41883.1 pectate lyase [Algoriphagus sp. TR-M9]